MNTYRIHTIVLGTKEFDKGMMTYQHDYGKPYTTPSYIWYLEGAGGNIILPLHEPKFAAIETIGD